MKRANIFIVILFVVGIMLTVVVEGYIIPQREAREAQYELDQRDALSHDFASVIPFANKYMGNFGNLSGLNYRLPLGYLSKTYELQSDNLSAHIIYHERADELTDLQLKLNIQYNVTANFVLIDNLAAVTMTLNDSSYTVRRSDVEKWYGVELSSLQDEELWKKRVQEHLYNEQEVEQFFSQVVTVE